MYTSNFGQFVPGKTRRENQCSGFVDLLLAAGKYGVLLQIKSILLNG
jgi:hypothetical protein